MTAPGRAALATIALDGPDAISIAARLFHSAQRISDFGRTRAHYYGRFGDSITDDVVLAVVEPGQTVEVHCHGGPVMVQQLIADIQTAGARLVAWHDLLLRQGQHPTRIEAAHTLSRARAPKAAAILLDQLNGALETAFSQIESRRNRSLANSLLRWTSLGLRLVEGWSIVLLGRPNVGKSSLLNAILGFERVIVSPQPGTTRDLIEVEATLDGWPVRITDGAGLRNSDDPVERIGVQRVRSWAQSADCRLFLQDISSHRHHEDIELIPEFDPHYIVGTKADLASPWTEHEMSELDYTVSVVDGRGIGQLLEAIVARLVPDAPPAGQPIPFTDRQVDWLTRWTNAQG